jgi:hypothetical protein
MWMLMPMQIEFYQVLRKHASQAWHYLGRPRPAVFFVGRFATLIMQPNSSAGEYL